MKNSIFFDKLICRLLMLINNVEKCLINDLKLFSMKRNDYGKSYLRKKN